jgi:DNA polymerase III subunit delta'
MKPYPWHEAQLAQLLRDRERIPHALLVQGPEGIGKAEFARALAASLLCESPRGVLACGACPSCHWLSQGNHPDFREVIPESEEEEAEGDAEAAAKADAKADAKKSLVIKVDQIRAQADFIALSTHRSGFRVLVIRPAEALHVAAANALLKTLEEPPPHTVIVLVSDQPARLLATIRSRCRTLALPMPAAEEALRWLAAEGVAEPRVALSVAGGAPLLARELAQPDEVQLRQRVLAELTRPSGSDPLGFAERIDRPALDRTIYWMQTWVQDLLRVRAGVAVRHHTEFAPAALAKARAANPEALFDLEQELRAARRLASHPLNARLVAEHLLMSYNRATSGAR